ncbi:MAG: cell division protein FtsW [Patescibacteria group bacterium]|nr:putative lipid II flippase FtsW [Patescibacteria group bacterium]MDE2015714.1 cell division protein FtsW [Patescibacteria group bacterium]MDE2226772.1 cell division protein FtsW [Patescibacteria group bacterium]
MFRSKKTGHRPDYFLFALIIIFVVFGLVMLASASSNLGQTKFNDSYYYLKHQIYFGLSLGLIGFCLGYFIYYQRLKKIALPLLLISIAALALVFTKLGLEVNNTNRWLRLGPLSFQPAELVKLTFILYLAAWLSNTKMNRSKDIGEGFLPFLLMSGFIATLLVLQPATSTVAILLVTALIVYLLSGAKIKYVVAVILLGAIGFGVVTYITPYRRARILGFLNMGQDTQGQNYHINQALIAIGSGGLWGVGYGQSATKTSYLPAPIDDSIFAVIGEELGFVGAGSLAAAFGIFAFRMFWLAKGLRDQFGKFLLIGFGAIIALQAFVNMGAISGLIPLTGVPLPFISYGGTALAVFLTMAGISLNVSKYA